MIYTLTFNPALDYVVHVTNFKENHTNRTNKEMIFYGGKGINISFVLKEFKLDSCALGFIASFTGDELQRGCQAHGIDTDFIQVEHGMTRINVKLKSNVETEINGMGPQIEAHHLHQLEDQLSKLKDGDILILSGSIPKGMSDHTYARLLSLLQTKNIMSIVDSTGNLLLNTLKYHPFLIKPNIHELEALFDVQINTKEELLPYANKLQEMGAKNVLISCGKDGAFLLDEFHQVHMIEACKGECKNSVGAGDSMVAGFLYGYLKTQDYSNALICGSIAGSATAFHDGLMTIDDFNTLFQQVGEEHA